MRCKALEDRLVELIVIAMEKTEAEMNMANDNQSGFDEISGATMWLWQHLSTQLIFFVLFHFCSFPHIVMAVHDKVKHRLFFTATLFEAANILEWGFKFDNFCSTQK